MLRGCRNRVGRDAHELDYSGDSSIIDALGVFLSTEENSETLLSCKLNFADLNDIRVKLPFLKDQ